MKRISALSSLLVCGTMLLRSTTLAQSGEPQVGDTELRRLRGFLCAGSNGVIRLGTPIAAFGPGQHWAGIIEHRLGAGLTNRFAPLVNHVDWLKNQARSEAYYGGYGNFAIRGGHDEATPSSQTIPTLLVDLKVKTRLAEKRRQKDVMILGDETMPGSPHWIYEIDEAELMQAEEINPHFLKAWAELNDVLNVIVATSLQPNSPAKRARLAEIIEQGSRAVNTMATQKTTQAFRDQVRAVEPAAYATRQFQVEGAQQWREQLELYSSRLGIAPRTPLPTRKEYPIAKWIRESESLEALLQRARETDDELVWIQRVPHTITYSSSEGITHYNRLFYELASLKPFEFEGLQFDARKAGDKSFTNSLPSDKYLADPTRPISSKELGVVLKPADTNLLRRYLLLTGWVVNERLPDGPDKGLMPGDLLPGYKSVYDIVISRWDIWLRRSLMFGEQTVYRGDKVFTVQGAK